MRFLRASEIGRSNTHLHECRVAIRFILCALVPIVLLIAVGQASWLKIVRAQPQTQLRQTNAPHLEEESCRIFVQRFYDWYWNQTEEKVENPELKLHQMHHYDDALRLKPAVLSQQLIRLMEREKRESGAAGGDIANLDFDPFLNSQDPSGKYSVQRVAITDGACLASMNQRHVVAELKKSGMAWLFVNFHYSFLSGDGTKKEYPDDDLIHILKR